MTIYTKTDLKKIKKAELVQMLLDAQAKHLNDQMDEDDDRAENAELERDGALDDLDELKKELKHVKWNHSDAERRAQEALAYWSKENEKLKEEVMKWKFISNRGGIECAKRDLDIEKLKEENKELKEENEEQERLTHHFVEKSKDYSDKITKVADIVGKLCDTTNPPVQDFHENISNVVGYYLRVKDLEIEKLKKFSDKDAVARYELTREKEIENYIWT